MGLSGRRFGRSQSLGSAPAFPAILHFSLVSEMRQDMGTQNWSSIAVPDGPRDPRSMAGEPRRRRRTPRTNECRAPLTKEQQNLAIRYLPLARSLAKRF